MRLSLLILISFCMVYVSNAQCVTYTLANKRDPLNPKNDTLNCTDINNKKQGRWVIKVAGLRGNPSYEEEGEFLNNTKDGSWRMYSSMGDLVAIENYKWGYKNGICQYFNVAGLEHEESWKSANPENPYDTVEVTNTNGSREKVIVKLDAKTLKHGIWKYYRPGSLTLIRTETYFLDKLTTPTIDESITNADAKKPTPNTKPKEVAEFEKKNTGKKKIKTRDGSVGY